MRDDAGQPRRRRCALARLLPPCLMQCSVSEAASASLRGGVRTHVGAQEGPVVLAKHMRTGSESAGCVLPADVTCDANGSTMSRLLPPAYRRWPGHLAAGGVSNRGRRGRGPEVPRSQCPASGRVHVRPARGAGLAGLPAAEPPHALPPPARAQPLQPPPHPGRGHRGPAAAAPVPGVGCPARRPARPVRDRRAARARGRLRPRLRPPPLARPCRLRLQRHQEAGHLRLHAPPARHPLRADPRLRPGPRQRRRRRPERPAPGGPDRPHRARRQGLPQRRPPGAPATPVRGYPARRRPAQPPPRPTPARPCPRRSSA